MRTIGGLFLFMAGYAGAVIEPLGWSMLAITVLCLPGWMLIDAAVERR
jgi:hypothetical protein